MSRVIRISTRSHHEWRDALRSLGRGVERVQSGGALRAVLYRSRSWHRLPESWWSALDRIEGRIDAVVYSYDTPIAVRVILDGDRIWDMHAPTAWVIPDVRVSVTTSRHQNMIAAATGAFRMQNPAELVGLFCSGSEVAEIAVALWPEWTGTINSLVSAAERLAGEGVKS